MFVLTKKKKQEIEIISASSDRCLMEHNFTEYIFSTASNGDEYTAADMAILLEKKVERVGNIIISLEEFNPLSDEEIIKRGGGVCKHCHSDETNPEGLVMEDGYVSRNVNCYICGYTTVETYSLSGTEE